MDNSIKHTLSFRRFGVITIVAVYLLIMVGGIVRSTGSGMGCPDWPRCFGQWVPPTELSQLPADYKQKFAVNGRQIADFDAFKTWTEYVNRLIGVLIGLFIFITLLFSLRFRKSDPPVFYFSLLAFLLVGFEGWLGARVVATHLQPGLVTVHMAVALLLVAVLIYAIARSFSHSGRSGAVKNKNRLNLLLTIALLFSFVQIVLGTQVREAIDTISEQLSYQQRDTWLELIGLKFYIHRSFSLLILGLNAYFVFLLHRSVPAGSALQSWGRVMLLVLLGGIASGVILGYFAIPAAMQPVHLLLGSLLFGLQFLLLLMLNPQQVFRRVGTGSTGPVRSQAISY